MCAVDKLQTAGDQTFMNLFKLDSTSPIGPVNQTHYPMRPRFIIREDLQLGRYISEANWGLIPFWAKDIKIGRNAFNARLESLLEGKPMFKAAFKYRRCLLPATSYIEFRAEEGKKIPYEFFVEGGAPYAYAGLWESRDDGTGSLESCSMLTTVPNELAGEFHTRMPAILRPEDYDAWLDLKSTPTQLISLIHPYDSSVMEAKRAG